MALYKPFARGVRAAYKVLHPLWRTLPADAPEGPAVYVIHHQNMFGPVHAMGLMPQEAHIWAFHCFLEREGCFQQFYAYTFTERYGWPKAIAYPPARLLSWIVPALLGSLSAIPVYHQASNLITMRQSLRCLEDGEQVAICPDVDYASTDPAIGEMYSGFLMLGTLYARRTGKPLPFVPVYVSRKRRRIAFGPAIHIDAGRPNDLAHQEAMDALREGINTLGRAMGDIPPSGQ